MIKIGGRYVISGVQLGQVIALIKNRRLLSAVKELKNVEDTQFLTNSERPIQEDIEDWLKKILEEDD